MYRGFVEKLLSKQIIRYILASALSLVLDFTVYMTLYPVFRPFYTQFIASTLGMLLNFKLQYSFVFKDKGMKKTHIFFLSTLGSVGGIFIGSTLIDLMSRFYLTAGHKVFNKFFVVGIIFVYNYLTKKVIFSYKR